MHESNVLEFKESITNSFLKTVSAFANYDGGTIVFGIDDDGIVVGIDNLLDSALAIENKVNDGIAPQPSYTVEPDEPTSTVVLHVKPGAATPYLYKAKAYKRSGTSTVEVDQIEFSRLLLAGKNMTFEQLPANIQELTFTVLGEKLVERTGVETFGKDTLKTLGLYSEISGYNNAAALLADTNDFPGIDMAQFGESVSIILRRVTSEGKSILQDLDEAVQVFRDLYTYEAIDGMDRKLVERIPEDAFREAVANALVHRTWDVRAQVCISMFDDRLEISSPGGLPAGMSEEEYLRGNVSVLRNPILANVFFRLGKIEAFGTGVRKIIEAYGGSVSKPRFEIGANSIVVVLPILAADLKLSADQEFVLGLLSRFHAVPISQLEDKVSFSRSKLAGILSVLVKEGLVVIEGAGRGTKYRRES